MKKIIIISLVIICFIMVNKNVNASDITIPAEAIRLRVLANSNSKYDQEVKMDVSFQIQNEIYNMLKDKTNIEDARDTLKNNINVLETAVEKILREKSYINTFKVEYGYNYFPEKEYKGVKYDAGEYESVLITLGEGKGNNWWCVLFPPLCLIEAEESDEVEYKFFVKELIEKYF
ncbi:MAG: stage II sporulation protein R [Bacilli bacterium]|nr:stage II sporulation protein R [Bacilli bacterium]